MTMLICTMHIVIANIPDLIGSFVRGHHIDKTSSDMEWNVLVLTMSTDILTYGQLDER